MKNYTYGWLIKERGYIELPVDEYSVHQRIMKGFIDSMSTIIANADCGWSGVRYEVMRNGNGYTEEYMVLYCNNGGSRWIPISGNSKGYNFTVLGENLW